MVAPGTSHPADDGRTSVDLERSGRKRLCGAAAGNRRTNSLRTEPGKGGRDYRLAAIQVIHCARNFARIGSQIPRGSRYHDRLKGFAEFFRRTVSDREIEDMDLAEAQLTRVIEQIGARELVAPSLPGAPLHQSTK